MPDTFSPDLTDASSLVYVPINGENGVVFSCNSWFVNNVIHHSENLKTVIVISGNYKIALAGFSSVHTQEREKLVEGDRVGIIDSTKSKLAIKVWRDGTILTTKEAWKILSKTDP